MPVGLALGLVGWAAAVVLGQLGLWRLVDAPLYDAIVRSAQSTPTDPRVAAVYVGDRDVEEFADEFGRWPWRSRVLHADAAYLVSEGGARVLGYDILFSEPSLDAERSDEQLMEALALAPAVVHGVLFRTGRGGPRASVTRSELATQALRTSGGSFGVDADGLDVLDGSDPDLPIDPLLDASPTLGHLNPTPDHDFAIRRVPLFVRCEGRLHPSLPLQMFLRAHDLGAEDVVFDPAARRVSIALTPDDVLEVPVDPDGTLWVHYDRPKEEVPAVLYSEVADAVDLGLFEDALVVIGVSVSGSTDTWRTPMDQQHQGFMIHAQVVENLLTRRFVRAIQPDRYPLGGQELVVHWLTLLGCGLLGLFVSRRDALVGWPATVLAATVPVVVGALWLRQGDVWLTPSTSAAALLFAGVLGAGHRQLTEVRERARIRRVYERYLSPAVLDAVLRDPALLHLGGARKELSVLFSDIRGFTAYSETVEPVELTARLNEYYVEMIGIAHRHRATIDKLIGDCLMAFWGDPLPLPDHALRAVRAAVETMERLEQMAEDWRARGVEVFEVGIGIECGEMAVGNLGSDEFVDYTVMGSVVNLAARLCGAAEPGEILIGPNANAAVAGEFETESTGMHSFKGIQGEREVFRVLRRTTGERPAAD